MQSSKTLAASLKTKMKSVIIILATVIIFVSCGLSSDISSCLENVSSKDLGLVWDSDAVILSQNRSINRDIFELTRKNVKGVFYDNEIGQITRNLNYGTCLADLWDGGYVSAIAFTDTVNKAFMLSKYSCTEIENWICYGDCNKLLSDKKIMQIIIGRNGVKMIRRKTSR